MDEIDRAIINTLQVGFPICPSPYKKVAKTLNISEQALIERLQTLLDNGILSRFGPMFHAEQMGGALTLAAIKAPQDNYDTMAEIINSFPEVAHNYAREHVLNMWFVLATETPEQIQQVINQIEAQTGLTVYNMPKIQEYFVGLKLEA
ncbi:Lrp/AsnC family transcriptional regulator [methanotrophic endosymbiont of Bathymodiolus puteoserpentis (Logatchev)]|jgi:DNA-binding Lrp family transcriptional regulator|uniref:Lrp/AsnC family transcriptional regulator n=1 Tax=methanotrophic endosymbiont of Bathymodiolus puteoserpentis (Logatchev) TaxID=343235 RepID=UPI0013CC2678|nr:AsnC family transcriptional regulator [methanotrophic endosymbiont of Bathymodiolus puteoserpentis (Logatchev)]SHE19465.1 Heme d1 biosynthesis protein NirG [methanotrophic endosymbiont of Bathymodiolus puteoserpentis (Logatchev)]